MRPLTPINPYRTLTLPSSRAVRFGDSLNPLDAVSKAVDEEEKKRSGNKFRFFMVNLIFTLPLALGIANVQLVENKLRQLENQRGAKPLTELLPANASREDSLLVDVIEKSNNVSPQAIREAAGKGLIKEIYLQISNLPITVPSLPALQSSPSFPKHYEALAVFKDGKEARIEGFTPDLMDELLVKHHIPHKRSAMNGFRMDGLMASAIAAAIVNGFYLLLTAPSRNRKLSKNEKVRHTAFETGQLIAAKRLKVNLKTLTHEALQAEISADNYHANSFQLSRKGIEKRIVVMLAGYVAEKRLLGEDASLASNQVLRFCSETYRDLITHYGYGDLFIPYPPDKLSKEQRRQRDTMAAQKATEALTCAEALLAEYSDEDLRKMHIALQKHPNSARKDITAVLKPTGTFPLISLFQKFWRRPNPPAS